MLSGCCNLNGQKAFLIVNKLQKPQILLKMFI